MEAYHITIIDNKTKETILDVDTCAIVAGVDVGECSRALVYSNCNALDLASTVRAAQDAVDAQTSEHPEVAALMEFFATMADSDTN